MLSRQIKHGGFLLSNSSMAPCCYVWEAPSGRIWEGESCSLLCTAATGMQNCRGHVVSKNEVNTCGEGAIKQSISGSVLGLVLINETTN